MKKNKLKSIKSVSLERLLSYTTLFFMCFTFTVENMQIHRFPLYFWFAVLAAGIILLMCIAHFKLVWVHSIWINAVVISILLSLIPAYVCTDLPQEYYYHAQGMPWRILLFYFLAGYVEREIKKGTGVLKLVRIGIKAGIILEMIWILLQYVLYNLCGINLNIAFFGDILHRNYNVTMFYWNGIQVMVAPSGMTQHSAFLIPMFILALLMFDNIWIRVLVFFEAFICRSSTAVVGVVITVGLLIFFAFIQGKFRPAVIKKRVRSVKIWQWILCVILLIAIMFAVVRFHIFGKIVEEMLFLLRRLYNLGIGDGSTDIHFLYFKYGLDEWKNANLLRKILGYGYYASGYPMEKYNELLTLARGSAVECDFVDILLSRGLIGFVVYYGWMFASAVRGLKTDHRYFIFIAAMLICGIGYNVQWEYAIFIEFVLYAAAKQGKSLFARQGFRIGRGKVAI